MALKDKLKLSWPYFIADPTPCKIRPKLLPECPLIRHHHWKEYSLPCSLHMSVLKSFHKRATYTPFLFCSWSLRNTNCLSPSLSFFQKQTLSLWLAYTHTVLLHLHSRSTQSSSHSIKPEDRCWISFLEEKSSAPFIGVELAWRAGEAGAPWEEGTGKKCVYACAFVCQRMQPSHPIYWEEKKGLLAKLAPVIGDPGVARSEAWLAVATWWQLLASHPVYTHIQAHFHTHRETNAHLDV